MFDRDFQKEYIFLRYLLNLIPPEQTQMLDLAGKLQLEYYRLQKTFEGEIALKDEVGTYTPAKAKGASKSEEETPLDEVIRKINEQYKGKFTDADKILVATLMTKLMKNIKLQNTAKTSDPMIFAESIFPQAFDTIANDSYIEAQEAFSSLFEDTAKYNAVMSNLGKVIYREMRI